MKGNVMRYVVFVALLAAAAASFGCRPGVDLPPGVDSNHKLITVVNLDTYRSVDNSTRTTFDILVKDMYSEDLLADAAVWVDVDGTAHHHRCDGQSPHQARHNIAASLSDQFTTRWRLSLLAVQLVHGFQIQQRFQ